MCYKMEFSLGRVCRVNMKVTVEPWGHRPPRHNVNGGHASYKMDGF